MGVVSSYPYPNRSKSGEIKKEKETNPQINSRSY